MISQRDEELIAKKLKFADFGGATRENHGKLKRVVHTLFRDDLEKQAYMIRMVCEKDPYIAADIISEMRVSEQAKKVLTEYMDKWEDDSIKAQTTQLSVWFVLQNKEKYQEKLLEYASYVNGNTSKKFSTFWIKNLKELLRFLEWTAEVRAIDSTVLNRAIRMCDIKQYDVDSCRDILKEIMGKLTEQNRASCCLTLFNSIGSNKYYQLSGMKYDEFVNVFDKWWRARTKEIGKKKGSEYWQTIRLDLEYCRAAFLNEDENTFVKFRERYLKENVSPQKLFYLSFLYEYQLTGDLSEESKAEIQKLMQEPVNATIWEKEDLQEELFKCVGVCMENHTDVSAFLECFQGINPYKMNRVVSGFQYEKKFSMVKCAEERKKLCSYIEENETVENIIRLYFNTHLRVTVNIHWLFHELEECNYLDEEINDILLQMPIEGLVKYNDSAGMIVFLKNILSRKALKYCEENDTRNIKVRLKRDDKVKVVLCVENGVLQIKQLLLGDEHLLKNNTQQERCEKCLEIIRIVLKERKIDETAENELNYYSAVAVAAVKENFAEWIQLLLDLSEDVTLFKIVLANLRWISKFRYKNTAEPINEDYSFYVEYHDICVMILKRLLKNKISIQDITSIYINTFLKMTISLYELTVLMLSEYPEAEIIESLRQYKFPGQRRENGRMVDIRNVRGSFHHVTDEKTSYRQMYCLSHLERGESLNLVFEIHQAATYNAIKKDMLIDVQKKYHILARSTNDCELTCRMLCNIPIGYYEKNDVIVERIDKYFQEVVYIRRHYTAELIKLLKHLSFHNLYCARHVPLYWNPSITEFGYKKWDEQRVKELAITIMRNETSISNCFFIFNNTFFKQHIGVYEFLEMCTMVNPTIHKNDFQQRIMTVGRIYKDEKNQLCYKPRDIFCEKSILVTEILCDGKNELVETEEDKLYKGYLEIKYEQEILDVICLRVHSIKDVFDSKL